MNDRLLHGEPVSDEQIQAWADEAERGYDLIKLLPPRLGRPLAGNCPGVASTAQSGEQPHNALKQRTSSEGE